MAEKTQYRCPRCGSAELRSDAEIWCAVNPNTMEILTDIFDDVPELASGGIPPTQCQDCDYTEETILAFDTSDSTWVEPDPVAAAAAREECWS